MIDLTCRHARADDLSTLVDFYSHLIDGRDASRPRSRHALETRMRGLIDGGYHAVLFCRADEAIGYALYELNPKYAYIRQIYIDPATDKPARLEDAFRLLRQTELQNYASIRIDVPESSKEWLKRWEAIGFRPRSVRLELETARKSGFRKSCGAVVYRVRFGRPEYLVVLHENGEHWGIPKGHVVKGETEMETAIREVHEETGLRITFREDFYERLYYLTPRERRKEVVIFLSRVRGQNVRLQRSELREYRWARYWEARELLSYENTKLVLDRAHEYLEARGT